MNLILLVYMYFRHYTSTTQLGVSTTQFRLCLSQLLNYGIPIMELLLLKAVGRVGSRVSSLGHLQDSFPSNHLYKEVTLQVINISCICIV